MCRWGDDQIDALNDLAGLETARESDVLKFITSIWPKEGDRLQEWAFAAAVKILLNNWAGALLEGYVISWLLKDVDEVIALLQEWKAMVETGLVDAEEAA